MEELIAKWIIEPKSILHFIEGTKFRRELKFLEHLASSGDAKYRKCQSFTKLVHTQNLVS